MAESKEEVKSLLMRVKEESEKTDLKLSVQKTKIVASGPIISWQIDGKKMETVTDFIFLGFKLLQMVTAAMKLKDACFRKGRGTRDQIAKHPLDHGKSKRVSEKHLLLLY